MHRILLVLPLALLPVSHAHEGGHGPQIAEMTAAAETFLATLDEKQEKAASFPFTDEERENWHFVPMDDRKGLRISTLQPAQVPLAYAFLGTGLSDEGLRTAGAIMQLEQYLAVKENNPQMRDPEKYFFSVFGQPYKHPWAWRYEGHHLSLNYTILDDKTLAYTPAFFGTNPAEIPDGPLKGSRPLGDIEDAARALVSRIHARMPEVVFTDKAPRDVITSQDRVAKDLDRVGASSASLKKDETAALREIVGMATRLVSPPDQASAGDPYARAATSNDGEIWFAWAGSMKKGEAHYFRVQAEDVLLEYANTQNDANHAHLVLRSPGRDFGRDLLKEHVEKEH